MANKKKSKKKTWIDAIKTTRPRFVAASQMHKSKRPRLLEKALSKASQE